MCFRREWGKCFLDRRQGMNEIRGVFYCFGEGFGSICAKIRSMGVGCVCKLWTGCNTVCVGQLIGFLSESYSKLRKATELPNFSYKANRSDLDRLCNIYRVGAVYDHFV